jgi:methylmalonyl-CoA mutase
VGVNTFLDARADEHASAPRELQLSRASEEEKQSQLSRVRAFREAHGDEAATALARLKEAATHGENVFAVLMEAARVCSLQQVTEAFFEVGGQYRRNV